MSVAASRYAKALLDVLYPAKAESGRDQLKKFLSVLSEQDDARLVLLEQYLRMTGRDDTFRERVDFYEAATLFRLMQVVMQRPEYARYFEALFALTRAPMEQLEWSEAG